LEKEFLGCPLGLIELGAELYRYIGCERDYIEERELKLSSS